MTADDWRAGGWMQTFSGRKFHPQDARPEDVDIDDIAHALAMTCRYGGHTDRLYSVAEHCTLLAEHMENNGHPELAAWALMHDAAEAYVGDLVRPVKVLFPEFKVLEDRLIAVIAHRFGLVGETIPDLVVEADTRILLDERKAFLKKPAGRWEQDDLEPLGVRPIGFPPPVAKRRFMSMFNRLIGENL